MGRFVAATATNSARSSSSHDLTRVNRAAAIQPYASLTSPRLATPVPSSLRLAQTPGCYSAGSTRAAGSRGADWSGEQKTLRLKSLRGRMVRESYFRSSTTLPFASTKDGEGQSPQPSRLSSKLGEAAARLVSLVLWISLYAALVGRRRACVVGELRGNTTQ
jgi:hypothetical protein